MKKSGKRKKKEKPIPVVLVESEEDAEKSEAAESAVRKYLDERKEKLSKPVDAEDADALSFTHAAKGVVEEGGRILGKVTDKVYSGWSKFFDGLNDLNEQVKKGKK